MNKIIGNMNKYIKSNIVERPVKRNSEITTDAVMKLGVASRFT